MLSAVPGDFNVDGIVDAADYSVWRDKSGSVYTAEDYGTWRTNFGTASISLLGTSIDVGKSGATAAGSILTISHAGTYWISGTLADGRIIVDTADEGTVKLVFDGVNITSSNNSPVTVANASNVVITLATGTQNYLKDGAAYSNGAATEPDAALFSSSDLTINGAGSLSVDANYADGIASKDNLTIESGTIMVDAVDDGIRGTDSVLIESGIITVISSGDGIKSTKGYVTASGGTINVTAGSDGIQAETLLTVSGSSIAAQVTGRGLTTSGDIAISAGTINVTNNGAAGRGLDADGNVTFSGGTTTVNLSGATVLAASGAGYDPSYPSGVKANGSISVSGAASVTVTGTSTATGARGLSADSAINVTGGTIQVTLAGNGATYINSSGVTDSYAAAALSSDLAINITDGNITTTSSGTGGKGLKSDGTITIGSAGGIPTLNITTTGARFLQSGTDYNHPKTIVATGAINIANGTITLNSTDDGIHSDSSITISGGTNIVTANSATRGVGEGIEAPIINFTGGVTSIIASNDGINATYGTVDGGINTNDGSQLNISGGIVIVAGSDGIDSNGNITITGGITIVDGPTSAPEEGIDYNGTFLINGGTVISAGSNASMTRAASTSSTQVNFFLKSSAALASSSLLHIQDSAGNEVVTYKPKNNVYYFHVSTSTLATNTSYSVYFGGTYTGGSYVGGLTSWGLLTGGTWSSTGATLKKTFISSASSTVNTVTM